MESNPGVLKIFFSILSFDIFIILGVYAKTFQLELFRVTNSELMTNSNNKMWSISHLVGQPMITVLHKMSLILIEQMIHALYREYICKYKTVQ
jgi:hypothetical protein